MKVLDLFCGAGGAAMGIHLGARAEITGWDINPQPDYPFDFNQGDATKLEAEYVAGFDLVWASPPCQAFSDISNVGGKKYPNLIPPTRKILEESGVPYIIENVPSAPLRKDLMLCGKMFSMRVIRHRIFELENWPVPQPLHMNHDEDYITVAGKGNGGPGSKHGYKTKEDWQKVMATGWMNRRQSIAESVPPFYSLYIITQGEAFAVPKQTAFNF